MSPSYLHPGVYVEEIQGGARPIEGVPTSVAVFAGAARRGPVRDPVRVGGWQDYVQAFGELYGPDDTLGLAVRAFFDNGGQAAYVTRLAGQNGSASLPVSGKSDGGPAAQDPVLIVKASSPGRWANDLRIRLIPSEKTNDDTFTVEVGHLEGEELAFTADEELAGLSMDERSPGYVLARNSDARLVQFALGPAADPTHDTNALGFGNLVGGPVAAADRASVTVGMVIYLDLDGGGPVQVKLSALSSTDGDDIAAALTTAVQTGPYKANRAFGKFTCSFEDNRFTLTSGTKSSSSSVAVLEGKPGDLVRLLHLDPSADPTSTTGRARILPAALKVHTDGRDGVPMTSPGSDVAPDDTAYTNFISGDLPQIPDVSIVLLPGRALPSSGQGDVVVDKALAWCESTHRAMLLVDPPEVALTSANVGNCVPHARSPHAAVYYPWLKVANPFKDPVRQPSQPSFLTVPPSAFVAGVWARVDGQRGVWKAPAGTQTPLYGVAGLARSVTDTDQDVLNPVGVNCLRQLPGYGPVVWGSRTLGTQAAPEWRYVPVKRTAIFIERSIANSIQWAVFEGNDETLWSALRTAVGSFMNGLFRAGAFQGATANEAYFVSCGKGQSMTQDDIDRGQVIVVVGFAPLKPAEFVIVRIQQTVGQ